MAQHLLTILAVRDLERASSFYRQAFPSWDATVEAPVYVEFALPGGQRVGVYQREGFARNTGVLPQDTDPGAITGTEIYLRCDDLEEAVGRVLHAGGRALAGPAPRDWGDEVAYLADPDGNVLALSRPLPAT